MAGGMAWGVSPEFKIQCHKKEKEKQAKMRFSISINLPANNNISVFFMEKSID
jgi:hypothetical protein